MRGCVLSAIRRVLLLGLAHTRLGHFAAHGALHRTRCLPRTRRVTGCPARSHHLRPGQHAVARVCAGPCARHLTGGGSRGYPAARAQCPGSISLSSFLFVLCLACSLPGDFLALVSIGNTPSDKKRLHNRPYFSLCVSSGYTGTGAAPASCAAVRADRLLTTAETLLRTLGQTCTGAPCCRTGGQPARVRV